MFYTVKKKNPVIFREKKQAAVVARIILLKQHKNVKYLQNNLYILQFKTVIYKNK